MNLKAATLITQADSHKFSKDFDHRNKMTAMQNVLDNSYFCRTVLSKVQTRPHLFLLENLKKCPSFKNKYPGSFHLWVKCLFEMQV